MADQLNSLPLICLSIAFDTNAVVAKRMISRKEKIRTKRLMGVLDMSTIPLGFIKANE